MNGKTHIGGVALLLIISSSNERCLRIHQDMKWRVKFFKRKILIITNGKVVNDL